jgi:hypothetical protein
VARGMRRGPGQYSRRRMWAQRRDFKDRSAAVTWTQWRGRGARCGVQTMLFEATAIATLDRARTRRHYLSEHRFRAETIRHFIASPTHFFIRSQSHQNFASMAEKPTKEGALQSLRNWGGMSYQSDCSSHVRTCSPTQYRKLGPANTARHLDNSTAHAAVPATADDVPTRAALFELFESERLQDGCCRYHGSVEWVVRVACSQEKERGYPHMRTEFQWLDC